MAKISMLNSSILDLNWSINQYAVQSKSFAERLVFHNNVRNHITKKTLYYDLGFDIFDKDGKLTKEGTDSVLSIMKENNLSEDASWYDAIKASHYFWRHSNSPEKNTYTFFDYMVKRT